MGALILALVGRAACVRLVQPRAGRCGRQAPDVIEVQLG